MPALTADRSLLPTARSELAAIAMVDLLIVISSTMPTLSDIVAARERIRDRVHLTPLLSATRLGAPVPRAPLQPVGGGLAPPRRVTYATGFVPDRSLRLWRLPQAGFVIRSPARTVLARDERPFQVNARDRARARRLASAGLVQRGHRVAKRLVAGRGDGGQKPRHAERCLLLVVIAACCASVIPQTNK